MKKFVIALAIVAAVAGVLALYLFSTAGAGEPMRFPLTADERALLATVPASADVFAIVPSAASLESKMRANPVAREMLERFSSSQPLPKPWMIGRATVVIWRSGKETYYLLRLDPVRTFLARAYLSLTGDESSSRVLLAEPDEARIPPDEVARIAALADALPSGDALVVQREGARGAFPPIGRPAVSSVAITPRAIDLVSRAAASSEPQPSSNTDHPAETSAASAALVKNARFGRNALLTAAFAAAPRLLDDMNRLVGAKASALLGDGGTVVVYGVDSGKLLPRPHEVLVIPATPEHREALQRLTSELLPREVTETIGFRVDTAEEGGNLLIAFDRDSIGRYRGDAFDAAQLPANRWSLALDAQRAAPLVEQLASNPGLRYLAPRLFRSVRDVGHWIEPLRAAGRIEAGLTGTPEVDELRVRIAPK